MNEVNGFEQINFDELMDIIGGTDEYCDLTEYFWS